MNSLTFLGTGTSSGVPFIGCPCEVCTSTDSKDQRLRSSVLVQTPECEILVDTGPDLRQQLLQHTPKSIDAIFYTHEHRDHTAGLDDTRPYYFKQQKNLKLYGNQDVEKSLLRDYHYAFGDNVYPGAPSFDYKVIAPLDEILVNNLCIKALEVHHGKLDILGYLFNNTVAYITDASALNAATIKALEGVDILIINALRIEKHHSHFNLDEALQMIDRLKPKKTYLTHISHLLGKHGAIEKTLPKGVKMAYDGLKINF